MGTAAIAFVPARRPCRIGFVGTPFPVIGMDDHREIIVDTGCERSGDDRQPVIQ